MVSCIYLITNLANGHTYVGQASDKDKRFKEHIKTLNGNYHCNIYLQRSWNLFGKECFKFEVLEECSIENLNDREQHYIDTLNPEYNMAPVAGSMLNYKHTKEAKANMSKAHIGKRCHTKEYKKKLSELMKGNKLNKGRKQNIQIEAMRVATKGKPKSLEHKAKIAASNRGKIISEETRKKMSDAAKKRRIVA